MSTCCNHNSELEKLRKQQSKTLQIVLVINTVMFVVIVAAGLYANSTALLSDSLDNFGDALTYALSLYAVHLGFRMKARIAFFKGVLIILAALAVLAQIGYKLENPAVPLFEVMGIFSLLALGANSVCLGLLWRHKSEDINMSSLWECSRNDIAANISVFVAAVGVWATGSHWPDLVVASFLAVFFLRSASRVLLSAQGELRSAA